MSTSRRWANTSRTSFGSPVNTCHMATRLLWEQRSRFRGHTKDNKTGYWCTYIYTYTYSSPGRNPIAFQMCYYIRSVVMIKGGAHMRCKDLYSYESTLSRSSAPQCFRRSSVIKIHNGMILTLYQGLPHTSCGSPV